MTKALPLRVIAASTVIIFSFTSTVGAQDAIQPFSTEVSYYSDHGTIVQLPEHLGHIEKQSIVPHQSPAVILIQDAHASYEAQRNIKRILEHLQENYGIQTFFLEGAAGPLDPSVLKLFPTEKRNLNAAEFLVERGVLSGAEWALMGPRPLRGFGVESLRLYKKNFAQYQAVLRESGDAIRWITKLQAQVLRKASRRFPPKLYKLFRALRSTKNLIEQASILEKYAETELLLDFAKARNQLDWPQLVRFAKLRRLQENLDLEEAAMEEERLARWISPFTPPLARLAFGGLPSPPWGKGISQLLSPKRLWRNWSESPRDFLERFYQAAAPKGFDFKKYPHLSMAMAQAVLDSEIEPALLQEEIERLRDRIFYSLAKKPEEKKLIEWDRGLALLKKLFSLELTPKEYEKLLDFDLCSQDDVNGYIGCHHLNPQFTARYKTALEFYRGAKRRDKVMSKRLVAQMKSMKLDRAVLVAGGFHAEGLEQAFQSRGISWLEILPHISEAGSSKSYQDKMLYRTPFSKTSQIPLARLMDTGSDYGREYRVFVRNELRLARQSVGGFNRSEVRADAEKRTATLKEQQEWLGQQITVYFLQEFPRLENQMLPVNNLYELPLLVSLNRIEAQPDIPSKAILILESILEEMDNSDKTLIQKMKTAVQNAIGQALGSGHLKQDFPKFLRKEAESALRELAQEAAHVPIMPIEHRRLRVSDEVQRQHGALPRLLKHYFTVQPELLQNPEVTQKLQAISQHMQERADLSSAVTDSLPQILDRMAVESGPKPFALPRLAKTARKEPVPDPAGPLPIADSDTVPEVKIETQIPADPFQGQAPVPLPVKETMEKTAEKPRDPDQANLDELILSLQEAAKAKNFVVIRILRGEVGALKQRLKERAEKRSELRSGEEEVPADSEGSLSNQPPEEFPSLEYLRKSKQLLRDQQIPEGFKPRAGARWERGKEAAAWAALGAGAGIVVNIGLATVASSGSSVSAFFAAALLGSASAVLSYGLMFFVKRGEEKYAFAASYNAFRRFHESTDPNFPEHELERAKSIIPLLSLPVFEMLCSQWAVNGQTWKLQRILESAHTVGQRHIIALTLSRVGLLSIRERYRERFHDEPEILERIDEDFQYWFKVGKYGAPDGVAVDIEILNSLLGKFSRYEEISYWMGALWAARHMSQTISLQEFEDRYAAFKGISQTLKRGAEHFSLSAEQFDAMMEEASSWISNLPAWSRDQPFFKAVQELLTRNISLSPNADWYLYGLKVVFSTTITSQQLPDVDTYLVRRVENTFVYKLLHASLLEGLDAENRQKAESGLKVLETLFGEPESEECALFTIIDILVRLRSLPEPQKVSRLRNLSLLRGAVRNLEMLPQLMRLYLDKEDAKDELIERSAAPIAQLVSRVDTLLHEASVESFRFRLGMFHQLIERLEQKAAEPRDVFRLLKVFDNAAPFPDVLQTCLRSWEALFNFYFDLAGKGNFEDLPDFLNALSEKHFKITILFPKILEVLTDPDMPRNERVAKLKELKTEYDLAEMGYPASLGAIWDAVSIESLFRSVGKKTLIRNRIHEPVVKNVLSKAGAKGLQSYWETGKPDYYIQFREDTAGIPDDFFAPGEKFRFAYARASHDKADDAEVAPVTNPVFVMKELVKDLRWRHGNLYENFIEPKRELLQGQPLENFIDEQSVEAVAKQFVAKLQDWELPSQEKIDAAIKVLGVLFHPEMAPNLREDAGESAEAKLARYWSDFLNHIKGRGYIRKGSKLQIALQNDVKKRLFMLVNDQTESREGVIQVMLTRGSLSDFFRGEISRDCTKEGEGRFHDTIGLPADPAFLAFKFVEAGRLIGNVYSMLFKLEKKFGAAKKAITLFILIRLRSILMRLWGIKGMNLAVNGRSSRPASLKECPGFWR